LKRIHAPAGDWTLIARHRWTGTTNVVLQGTNFAGQGVAIDLGQIAAPLVQTRGLQRLPTSLNAIVGEIRGDRMSVKLGI